MGKPKIDILHEDEAVVLVNKPPGMLTIPDRYDPSLPNLLHWLKSRWDSIYVVHRLDKDTSGILCFARTEAAHKHLSLQFQQRTVDKHYLALVDGIPQPATGTIDLPIAKSKTSGAKMVVGQNGKPALTLYETVEVFGQHALLALNIKTGRTHQVRVHMEAIGHPLVVDPMYGRRGAIYLSEIKGRRFKRSKGEEERPLVSRVTLHSHRLVFDHPSTEERISFEAEPPKDFRALVRQLGKWMRTGG